MTMTVHKLEAPFRGPDRAYRELRIAIAGATERLSRLWSAIQARRSINQLLAWDDRMLGDIGITRGDVVSSLSGTITDHPGLRLSRLASERKIAALAARPAPAAPIVTATPNISPRNSRTETPARGKAFVALVGH